VPAPHSSPVLAALAAAALAALLTGCSRDAIERRMSTADSVRADDPVWKSVRPPRQEAVSMTEPNVVTMVARDYTFEAPTEIPAGFTTLRLVNSGQEIHNLELVKVDRSHSSGELITALQMGKPRPSWAVAVGGPNQVAPGGESNATFLLEPGDYAVICPVVGKDGKIHFTHGMARPLTVTSEGARVAPEPTPDLTMTLVDYDYEIKQPVPAGRHAIRITNRGKQPHEVLLVRLTPGKRASDYVAWYAKQTGDPPGELKGGVTAIAPGRSATVTADLEAGRYALLCLIPDEGDGRPHVEHGMIREIVIG
jgi:uncharacterized cupredoxin-like copper-binding protein